MQVKRPVIVTAIVTEGLKQEYQQEIEESLRRVNESQQELESQSRRYMLQIPSADMANAFRRQVEEETRKHDSAKKELQERQAAVEQLQIGERVTYMQLEGYVELNQGDNLRDKLGRAEIIVKDGVIQELRDGTGGPDSLDSGPGGGLIQRA
ncbi:MAG: YlqD family protein [Armatimonadetes bacterium]|nr:YlqD family protein [Armatimonadota bacterium]